ncbi:cupin domain-containing protein [Chryseobacterium arthrosphaerae]|uniref:cupin domain-containing protein n=1 Tax=Chryseobacterium arthrosphaerae TaxID=651561 RepID=UPI003D325758
MSFTSTPNEENDEDLGSSDSEHIDNFADCKFDDGTYSATVVTFEPGARPKWHLHPGGQIILVTDGIGYYQEKGQQKKILHKGDVIKCPPNVEHWHGASKDSYFVQVAVTDNKNGSVIWLQPVTEEEYYK